MRDRIVTFLWIAGWLVVLAVIAFTSGRPGPQPVMGEPMTQASFDQSICKHVLRQCRKTLNDEPNVNVVQAERQCAAHIVVYCAGFKWV